MNEVSAGGLSVSLGQEGSHEYLKVSYPLRYGRYHQITDGSYVYQFDLRGTIRHLHGTGPSWPANEWLKRTTGSDWVYYSNNGYTSVYALLGEHYLPCFSYVKHPFLSVDPFTTGAVRDALQSLDRLYGEVERALGDSLAPDVRAFLERVAQKAQPASRPGTPALHEIIGGPVSVLPPDTRHVDYDVIPVLIADGCLYNCGFCAVKSQQPFAARSREQITEQIERLRDFYGPDLVNFNSIFLGQHDALQAGEELIAFAAEKAYDRLGPGSSFMRGAKLFFFGSVDSFLDSPDSLFQYLEQSPYRSYINLGLESADQASLDELGKPLTSGRVRDAFRRMVELNRRLETAEVTANFVLGPSLPAGHLDSIARLAGDGLEATSHKSTVYISPLMSGEVVPDIRRSVYAIKNRCRVPVFMYLIQRL